MKQCSEPLLSPKPYMRKNYREALPTSRPSRMLQTVLAGTGYLSRRMSNLDALPYRQAVVSRMGLIEKPHLMPVITVLNKKVGCGEGRAGRSVSAVVCMLALSSSSQPEPIQYRAKGASMRCCTAPRTHVRLIPNRSTVTPRTCL